MGCSPSSETVINDRERFEKPRSKVIHDKNPFTFIPKDPLLPPIGHHASRKSHKKMESRAREKSSELKQNQNPSDKRNVVTHIYHAKADEVNTTPTGHINKGKTSGHSELVSTQETKEGSSLTPRREHFPFQKTETPGNVWLQDSSGLENWKTSDQTKLFSKEERKYRSTLTARREHIPSENTESPGNAWLEGSSGLDNRKTTEQTKLFSKQEANDGSTLTARREHIPSENTESPGNAWLEGSSGLDNRQPLDLTGGDHTMTFKKKKKKKRTHDETSLTHSRDAKHHKEAERNENHYAGSSHDMIAFQEYQTNINRLERLVSQVREEKAGLLSRLSEVGAIKLTENNPNVTDLSDENRPEMLVEQFSELYDNEWTDAYEYLTRTRNESMEWSVKRLLQVLQETFNVCILSTEKKKETLRNAITDFVGLTKQEQDEIEFKDVEKKLREYRWKKLTNNFKKTEQEVGDKLKGIFTTETFEKVSEYIGSCIRICCKMGIKEPPMYLDFGYSKEPAQSISKTATKTHFDKDRFMCYTKSGNYIDYVVWPAVYLYKDGPRMKRGVAQGIYEDEEYEDGTNSPT